MRSISPLIRFESPVVGNTAPKMKRMASYLITHSQSVMGSELMNGETPTAGKGEELHERPWLSV
ncbi:MAG TPA: hypothetical protein VFW94_10880 [Candidatus Acidoferrales bacterium]|nr:hypothetical protein [Candidatus Acidoferrales bacterium]